ncbi:MAG: hypothetical protein ACI8VY_000163, partial [Cellvibrionaceae bacterium]
CYSMPSYLACVSSGTRALFLLKKTPILVAVAPI